MADMVRVDRQCWVALKIAATRMDITIIEILRRIAQGDAESIARYQREYKEADANEPR